MKAAPSARKPGGQGLGRQGHGSRGSRMLCPRGPRESMWVQEAGAGPWVRAEMRATGGKKPAGQVEHKMRKAEGL